MNIIKTIALCSTLILLGAILAQMPSDYDIEVMEEQAYCQNVDTWNEYKRQDGGSDYGHPDFKGIYEIACKSNQGAA